MQRLRGSDHVEMTRQERQRFDLADDVPASPQTGRQASHQIDRAIEGKTGTTAVLTGIQEYAAECAMLKVLGTETLDYCVDEGVQIHGGYGFLQDYPIERAYRDSRINRLFEGTNEINRLLAPATLVRKAAKGEMSLAAPVSRASRSSTSPRTEP